MKKSVVFLVLIIMVTAVFAKEMKFENIQKAYKKSYDYETMQKYEKAIKSLSEVYKNYSDSYTVNYRLGWLYYLNKNYKNALVHLNTALSVFPSSIEVLNTIDLVYVAQQDWNKLEENAIKIINIGYYNTYANYWYSFSLKKQGKYDLALKVDYKMLALFPSSVSFLTELAENLYLSGNMELADKEFKNVLILDSLNETAKYYHKLIEEKKNKGNKQAKK